jgi:hypothetical protein
LHFVEFCSALAARSPVVPSLFHLAAVQLQTTLVHAFVVAGFCVPTAALWAYVRWIVAMIMQVYCGWTFSLALPSKSLSGLRKRHALLLRPALAKIGAACHGSMRSCCS